MAAVLCITTNQQPLGREPTLNTFPWTDMVLSLRLDQGENSVGQKVQEGEREEKKTAYAPWFIFHLTFLVP